MSVQGQTPTLGKGSDLRKSVRLWHGNDPCYNDIVGKIPSTTEYCWGQDRRGANSRLQSVVSGCHPPLSKKSVASMCIREFSAGERAITLSPRASSYIKNALEHMRASLLRAASEHRDMYEGSSTERLSKMSIILEGIIDELLPSDVDIRMAIEMKSSIEKFVKRLAGVKSLRKYELNLHVSSFGSRASNLHSQHSDMDLSIEGTFCYRCPHTQKSIKRESIYKFASKIQKNMLHMLTSLLRSPETQFAVQPILRARVPVLKVRHRRSGLESDICISDDLQRFPKSELLLCLNLVDARFRMLLMLVKTWASYQGIQDASQGRLNSYTLTSLVTFHLQTRPIPILPRLRDVIGSQSVAQSSFESNNNSDSTANRKAAIRDMVHGIVSWKNNVETNTSTRNKETILELFASFLVLMNGLFTGWAGTISKHTQSQSKKGKTCTTGESNTVPRWVTRFMRLSTYHGCIYFGEEPEHVFTDEVYKNQRDLDTRQGVIFIEDPFDMNDNSARALSPKCFKSICQALKRSLDSFAMDTTDMWCYRMFGVSEEDILRRSQTTIDGGKANTDTTSGKKKPRKHRARKTRVKDEHAKNQHETHKVLTLQKQSTPGTTSSAPQKKPKKKNSIKKEQKR